MRVQKNQFFFGLGLTRAGNGLPDIIQLVPLAKIFGVTTDSLLGVETASYGKAHTNIAENHVSLLMASSKPIPEKLKKPTTTLKPNTKSNNRFFIIKNFPFFRTLL